MTGITIFLGLSTSALGKYDLSDLPASCKWFSGVRERPLGFAPEDPDNIIESVYSKSGNSVVLYRDFGGTIVDRKSGKSLDLHNCRANKRRGLFAPHFSEDESVFYCIGPGNSQEELRIYDLKKQSVAAFPLGNNPYHVNTSHNRRYVFSADLGSSPLTELIDTQTGKRTTLGQGDKEYFSTPATSAFSPDNKTVAFATRRERESLDDHIEIVSTESPTKKPLIIKPSEIKNKTGLTTIDIENLSFSKDGTKLFVNTRGGITLVYPSSGKGDPTVIRNPNMPKNHYGPVETFIPISGSDLAIASVPHSDRDPQLMIRNMNTGKDIPADKCGTPISVKEDSNTVPLLENHSSTPWIVTQLYSTKKDSSEQMSYSLLDPTTLRCITLFAANPKNVLDPYVRVIVSKDDSKASFTIAGGGNLTRIAMTDLKTGSKTNFDFYPANNEHWSESMPLIDIETGSFLGKKWAKGDGKSYRFYGDLPICVTNELKLAAPPENDKSFAACTPMSDHPGVSSASISFARDVALKTACDGNFEKSAWITLTPKLKLDGTITPDIAENFLYRFQKISGFEPKEHLPVLILLIENGYLEKKPDLMAGAMQTVYLTSKPLYQELIEAYPKLLKMPVNTKFRNPCRSEDEHKKFAENLKEWVAQEKKSRGPYGSNLNTWEKFKNYFNLFRHYSSKISQETKDDLTDYYGQVLADAAADTPEFHGAFVSKLYKFTSAHVKRSLFGDTIPPLTDLTLVREADHFQPIIFGIDPIDGDESTLTKYGFYSRILPKISVNEIPKTDVNYEKTISWSQNGETYSGELSFQRAKSKKNGDIVPKGNGPKYNELWADKTLTGVIITGSNLGALTESTLNEYLEYFKSNGFKFQDSPTHVKDIKKLLKTGIEGGEFDYLIKEAHSDGDEKNLFRYNIAGNYLKGIKHLGNGMKEWNAPLKLDT